jgi:hypothetical protein
MLLSPCATRLGAQNSSNSDGSTVAPPLDVASSQPGALQIGSWIEALGHDAYAVRQDAARQLLAAGIDAREPLVAAAENADPERRAAARRLVALIERAEFDRRLAAFAADTNGQNRLSLPGWEQFQKIVGRDAAARALFVDMQRQESALLADVFDANRGARKLAWEDRLLRLLRWPAMPANNPLGPPAGSCASMIFLGSVSEGAVSDRGAAYLQQLIAMPSIQQPVRNAPRQDPMRRLVSAWVVECPNQNPAVLQQRLNMAIILNLPEAVPLAVRIARNDSAQLHLQPMVRITALSVVANLGERTDAEPLEPLLEDATVCMSFAQAPGGPAAVVRQIQIRDAALVAMVLLTDQDPAVYGYRHARRQSQQLLDPSSLFTDTDEQRTAAILKWREWKATQAPPPAAQKPLN